MERRIGKTAFALAAMRAAVLVAAALLSQVAAAASDIETGSRTQAESEPGKPKSADRGIERIPASEIPKIGDAASGTLEQDDREPNVLDDLPRTEPDESATPIFEAPLPVLRDLSSLPAAAARMRELILEAARSGDIERLRPLIGTGPTATTLSVSGEEGDPIAFLKSLSGDPEGREILAIMIEVLEAGFVRLDENDENEIFIWPYFFAMPLNALTPSQQVELFKLVTAGDLADMQAFGAYVFYRIGITPTGEWQFFVAGD